MERLTLPGTTLSVSAICMGLGGFGARIRGAEAERLLATYLEQGGNFVDTAHCYACWIPDAGAGSSERALGACLRSLGAREHVVIGTKGGHTAFGEGYPRPDAFLAPERVALDLAESLERLQTQRIELYYLHRDDPRVPVGEIMDALNRHIQAGAIREIAASNWSEARMDAANAYAAERGLRPFVASQVQWSLATPAREIGPDPTTRYVTPETAAWHTRTGMPIIAYSSAAGGFFADPPRVSAQYDTAVNHARRERSHALAAELGATPTQVALAYLRAQAFPVVPILGTVNRDHLLEELGAVSLRLTAAQAAWLESGETQR